MLRGRPVTFEVCFLWLCACGRPPAGDAPASGSDLEPGGCLSPLSLHRDADGDGLGDPATSLRACPRPEGWVADATDCDDGDAAIGGPRPWHLDADGDGAGAIAAVYACEAPPGAVDDASDCDDARADVHPGGTELCADGLDGDCDGSASPCRYEGDVSLARALRFTGHAEYGEAGRQAIGVGDVNADGYDDVAVGAGLAPGEFDDAGEVYLLLGPLTRGRPLTEASATISGDREHSHVSVCEWIGDSNADGYSDLLSFRTASGHDPGVLAVLSGEVAGLYPFDALPVAEVPYFVRYSGIGDLDGDGRDDLIGTDVEDWTGGFAAGAAYVFTGPLTGQLEREDAAYTFYGTEGMLVNVPANVGDLDADGRPDIALGGGTASFVDFFSGAVYLVTEPLPGVQSLADADAVLHGAAHEEQAGTDLDGAGDVNGDGYGDLIISSMTFRSEDRTYEQRVAATLVLGPISGEHLLPDIGARFTCSDFRDGLQSNVAGVGDLNADGFDDYAIGAPIAENLDGDDVGAVFLFYGPEAVSSDLYDAPARLYGESFSMAGDSLDSAGDVDGDGQGDLIVGAWYFYGDNPASPQPRIGAAYVVLGGAL